VCGAGEGFGIGGLTAGGFADGGTGTGTGAAGGLGTGRGLKPFGGHLDFSSKGTERWKIYEHCVKRC